MMSSLIPKVSVVMSCYNAERTVGRAMDSILQQPFTSFEFIIIEDGSTDNTYELLEKARDQDPRIRLFKNAKNIGLAASLNKGIANSRANIIVRMDADDEALHDRLEKQVSFLDINKEVDIVGSGVYLRTHEGLVLKSRFLPETHEDIIRKAFRKPMLYHPTVAVRKSVFIDYGGYDPGILWAEDADLWYRIYDRVRFHNIQEPLLYYTVKDKLSFRQAFFNLKVKYINLKRRNLVIPYLPQLGKDIILLTFKIIKYSN